MTARLGLAAACLLLIALPATAAAAPAPKLGAKNLFGPYGKGWGAVKPAIFYNGGAPSGLVRKVRWTGWGRAEARGKGWGSAYKPGGGYYRRSVKVDVKALRLGTCRGKRAYTRMLVRMQERPGGPYGDWFPWALDLCKPVADLTECADIGFEENTDNVADEIRVFDTTCATADPVVRSSLGVAPYSSDDGFYKYRYTRDGFACNGYAFDGEGLAHVNWVCLRGTAQITFKKY